MPCAAIFLIVIALIWLVAVVVKIGADIVLIILGAMAAAILAGTVLIVVFFAITSFLDRLFSRKGD